MCDGFGFESSAGWVGTLWAGGEEMATSSLHITDGVPDAPAERLEQALVAMDQNSTIIAVIEMSQSSWLVRDELGSVERRDFVHIDVAVQGGVEDALISLEQLPYARLHRLLR
jgi:hypothetical protein